MAETTRARLEQGLISLLQKKPLRHIHVQDIAQESGLTRQVFYRYFHTRDDLIHWIYMKDFTTAFVGKTTVSWNEMILIMMQTLKNRAYFYQRLVRHHDDNTLYRIMRAYTENLYRRIILYHTGNKRILVQISFYGFTQAAVLKCRSTGYAAVWISLRKNFWNGFCKLSPILCGNSLLVFLFQLL